MIATFMADPAQGEVSRRTAFVRNNGLLEQASRASRSSRTTARTSAARSSRTARSTAAARSTTGDVTLIPTISTAGFGCPCHGGQYDTEGNRTAGPPVRALDRYSFSIHNGHLFLGTPFSVSQVDGTGADREDPQVDARVPGRARRRPRGLALSDPAAPLMATRRRTRSSRSGADPLPARLARGALGPRRRHQVLPLPQGAGRHQLVPDARLGDADGVHRPGADRRDPRDVLQAGPDDGVLVDPAHHERRLRRLARARHAPLGRVGVHHPDVHAHGAGVPVRRLQVPARAELDHRRAAARARACSRASPATCCRGTRRRTGRRSSGSTSTARRRSSGRSSRSSCKAGHTSAPTRCRASTRSTCC